MTPRSPRSVAPGPSTGQQTATRRAELFLLLCRSRGITPPATEHAFWPGRRFRFDFAWVERRIALESEGGTWNGGRHSRGSGFKRDTEKYNEAALRGWTVLRVLSSELCTLATIALIERALATPHPEAA